MKIPYVLLQTPKGIGVFSTTPAPGGAKYPEMLLESIGIQATNPVALRKYIRESKDSRFIREAQYLAPLKYCLTFCQIECAPISGAEKRYVPQWYIAIFGFNKAGNLIKEYRHDEELAELFLVSLPELQEKVKTLFEDMLPISRISNNYTKEEIYFQKRPTDESLLLLQKLAAWAILQDSDLGLPETEILYTLEDPRVGRKRCVGSITAS